MQSELLISRSIKMFHYLLKDKFLWLYVYMDLNTPDFKKMLFIGNGLLTYKSLDIQQLYFEEEIFENK